MRRNWKGYRDVGLARMHRKEKSTAEHAEYAEEIWIPSIHRWFSERAVQEL
jgi:hypothetical protein